MRRFIFRFSRLVFVLLSVFLTMLTTTSFGRKCFNVENNEITIKELDYEKAISIPECASDVYFKPGQAKYLTLDHSCQKEGVGLSWTVGHSRPLLGGYLLEVQIDVEGPMRIINYLQVTIPPRLRQESVQMRCFNLTSSSRLSVTVRPLSRKQEKCGEQAYTSVNTATDWLRRKCSVPICVCQSSVTIKSSVSHDRGSILGIISITKLPADTNVRVELEHMDGTVHQRWTLRWKEGQVEVTVEARDVPPGKYIFKVHRRCETHISSKSMCGREKPPVIISNTIIVDNVTTNPDVDLRRSTLQEIVAPTASNIESLWLILICVCSVVIGLAVLASLMVYRTGRRTPRRYANAQTIYGQLRADDKRRKVAIIFAKDTRPHIRRVYRLQTDLTKHGVNAVVVDETTNIAVRENWIDEGENIPNRFDVLLFIMSPILYELCHRNQTGLVELADHGHVVHRLPAAILHALSVKPYYANGNSPQVFVVSLDRTSKESNPTIKSFLKEHRGICYPKPIFLLEKDVQKLAKKIKAQPLVTS